MLEMNNRPPHPKYGGETSKGKFSNLLWPLAPNLVFDRLARMTHRKQKIHSPDGESTDDHGRGY